MPDQTPAEQLHAAAAKLRGASQVATPGPWTWNRWHSDTCPLNCDDPACFLLLVGSPTSMVGSADVDRPEVFAVERSVQDRGEDDAEFIALMHPSVGAALADWLEHMAEFLDDVKLLHGDFTKTALRNARHALAVARQILGEVTQ